jgi:hypothetical protein
MKNNARNRAILKSYKSGSSKQDIARDFHLSIYSVNKIVNNELSKEKLFYKLRNKGIFWSYDKNITYFDINDQIFIEYTLKYGEFFDIDNIITLYGIKYVKKVWLKYMKSDAQFIKTNLLIARVFLNMDVESDYFKDIENGRARKIRQLAS